ncbi:uncharacterized protein LOC143037687 isoform X2 [Oratosquilla oratoria]|uniref:uncharacterized protein LOC143037687 isoform X2 n=1 Tax=Oratosquilla oratoria TaxID=337810 RepID=UPI003F76E82F
MVVLFIYYQHLRDRHLKEMRDHGLKEERLMMTIKQSTKDHEMEVSNLKSRFVQMNLALSELMNRTRDLSIERDSVRLTAKQWDNVVLFLKSEYELVGQENIELQKNLNSIEVHKVNEMDIEDQKTENLMLENEIGKMLKETELDKMKLRYFNESLHKNSTQLTENKKRLQQRTLLLQEFVKRVEECKAQVEKEK